MNQDGSDQRNITNHASEDYDPIWSPDGSRIAFVSNRDGDTDIFIIHNDGSSPTNITSSFGSDLNPAWSPDGKSIAFTSNRSGQFEIYVTEIDGSTVSPVSQNGAREYSWSPDGDKIA